MVSKIKKMIKIIIYGKKASSKQYIGYLRKKGCSIGKNTFFFKPQSVNIDENRLRYISIGDNCKITEGVKIIAHDYSWENLVGIYKEIIPTGPKKISIGNNVFIGMNSIILGPVKIGDNVIIGANSLVKKDIPSNVVAAGNPAKVICSIEDYYKKNKENLIKQAYMEFKSFYNLHNRAPKIEECGYFCVIFLDRTSDNYNKYILNLPWHGDDIKNIKEAFFESKPIFLKYSDYLEKMMIMYKNDQN